MYPCTRTLIGVVSHSEAREVPGLVATLEALARVSRSVTAIEDPARRAQAVREVRDALDHEMDALMTILVVAVHELRQDGASYDKIAASTGLSKAWVARLSRRHPDHTPGRARGN